MQQLELLLSADHGHRHGQSPAGRVRHRQRTPGLDAVGEASGLLGPERRRHDDAPCQLLDAGAEQHLTRLRRLLQARRGVDRYARGERRLRLVREDLAGLDPDPYL